MVLGTLLFVLDLRVLEREDGWRLEVSPAECPGRGTLQYRALYLVLVILYTTVAVRGTARRHVGSLMQYRHARQRTLTERVQPTGLVYALAAAAIKYHRQSS